MIFFCSFVWKSKIQPLIGLSFLVNIPWLQQKSFSTHRRKPNIYKSKTRMSRTSIDINILFVGIKMRNLSIQRKCGACSILYVCDVCLFLLRSFGAVRNVLALSSTQWWWFSFSFSFVEIKRILYNIQYTNIYTHTNTHSRA